MLFILLIVAPALVSSANRPPGLYSDRDPVIILKDSNFHETISNKEHAWVVEFYASWCGYCRNFAPTFSRFAGELTQWRDVIQVAVIDCGDDVNAETICMGANLTGYPTIKYYLPFTNTMQGEYGYNRDSHVSFSYSRIYLNKSFKDHSGEALLIDTIDFVESMIDQMVELNPNLYQLWPRLGLNSNDSSLFGFVNPDKETQNKLVTVSASQVNRETESLIIVEDEASYIGKQVILDKWRRKKDQPIISRISVSPSDKEDVLRKLNVSALPIVAIMEPDTEKVILLKPAANTENLKKGLEKVIDDYLGVDTSYIRTTLKPLSNDVSTVKAASEGDIIRRRYSVYQSDLDKTVISSLSNEVLLRSSLTNDQRNTLYQYLNILSRFYPTEAYAYNLISNLYKKINQTEDVDLLRSIVEEYPESTDWDWVGCKGSSDLYGGYTCGLWTLWHFLTVAQAEAASGDPTDVLLAMTHYVRDFFGCQECSEHFLQMVDDGDNITSVRSYEEAVLYLWDRHNEVNLRLIESEQVDDPVFPKEYFPNVYHCPSCFPDGGYGGSVDEKEIINFLMNLYKKESLLKSSEGSSASLSILVTKDSFVNLAMILMIFL